MVTIRNAINLVESMMKEGIPFRSTVDASSEAALNPHDTMDEAHLYLAQHYPIKKNYTVSRLEPGFRYFDNPESVTRKILSGLSAINSAVEQLQLKQNSVYSGSKQTTASLGHSWLTFENPSIGMGMLYYQDRGMGSDSISLYAKDKPVLDQMIQVMIDAGVIIDPSERAAKRAEKTTKRSDLLAKKGIKVGTKIKINYGRDIVEVVQISDNGTFSIQRPDGQVEKNWKAGSVAKSDIVV